mmetsp:Transcript_25865/g.60245  ORF Transcript_25865/g.60245 Transcript_25865/m.60245 type:complete len:389 (-) Transcript_25865:99-1265(-)
MLAGLEMAGPQESSSSLSGSCGDRLDEADPEWCIGSSSSSDSEVKAPPSSPSLEEFALEQRERKTLRVSEMAVAYRAELGQQLAAWKPTQPLSRGDGIARSVLEIMAEEFCAERGLFPAAPQPPATVPCESLGPGGGVGPSDIGPDNTIIIFDWDDTLFPTWFVQQVVLPGLPPNNKAGALPADSPFHEALAAHASTLRAVLMLARAFAQVAIVTLAMRPWVFSSTERFLPGLDLADLLRTLGIPVFYAREHVKRPDTCLAQVEEGVDLFTVAKRATILKCLRKLSRNRKGLRMNVISIGDSLAEMDAVKEVLWAACEQQPGLAATPLCKTVKFVCQPSMQQLGDELHLLAMWLKKMAAHNEDFDVSMDGLECATSFGGPQDSFPLRP